MVDILESTIVEDHQERAESEEGGPEKKDSEVEWEFTAVGPIDKAAKDTVRGAMIEIMQAEFLQHQWPTCFQLAPKIQRPILEQKNPHTPSIRQQMVIVPEGRNCMQPTRYPAVPSFESLRENLQRKNTGQWTSESSSCWRGNRKLMSCPPPMPLLPEHWTINDEEQSATVEGPAASSKRRWRDASEDVGRIANAKAMGYYPEILQANTIGNDDGFAISLFEIPTTRRPQDHRRQFLQSLPDDFEEWLEDFPHLIGGLAKAPQQRQSAKLLIATWRDLFVTDIRKMPETDLIEHRIPTYRNAIPRIA